MREEVIFSWNCRREQLITHLHSLGTTASLGTKPLLFLISGKERGAAGDGEGRHWRMRHLLSAEDRAGARFTTHHSAAELNPALAPRGLDAFVRGLAHLWDWKMED